MFRFLFFRRAGIGLLKQIGKSLKDLFAFFFYSARKKTGPSIYEIISKIQEYSSQIMRNCGILNLSEIFI